MTVIGLPHLSRKVPVHASQMYGANIVNLVDHFWDKESRSFLLDRDDEIMAGCLIVHDGKIVNEMIRTRREGVVAS